MGSTALFKPLVAEMGRRSEKRWRLLHVFLFLSALEFGCVALEVGRRGGAFLSTTGSFTLSSGSNTAGNDEALANEELGQGLDDAPEIPIQVANTYEKKMKQKMRTTLLKHGVEKSKIDSAMHELGEEHSVQWLLKNEEALTLDSQDLGENDKITKRPDVAWAVKKARKATKKATKKPAKKTKAATPKAGGKAKTKGAAKNTQPSESSTPSVMQGIIDYYRPIVIKKQRYNWKAYCKACKTDQAGDACKTCVDDQMLGKVGMWTTFRSPSEWVAMLNGTAWQLKGSGYKSEEDLKKRLGGEVPVDAKFMKERLTKAQWVKGPWYYTKKAWSWTKSNTVSPSFAKTFLFQNNPKKGKYGVKVGWTPVATGKIIYIPVYVKAIASTDTGKKKRFESIKRLVRCFMVKCGDKYVNKGDELKHTPSKHDDSANDGLCYKCFGKEKGERAKCEELLNKPYNGGKLQEVDCKGDAELGFSIQ